MNKKKLIIPIIAIIMLILTVSFATAVATAPDSADVQMYYSFDNDDLNSGLPLDLTDNNVDATTNTANTDATGILNEGFDYVLANSDYTEIASHEFDTSVISLSVWLKFDVTSNYIEFINLDGGTTNTNDVAFLYYDVGSPYFQFAFRESGKGVYWSADIDTYLDDEFHHFITIYDGGSKSSASSYDLYIDGSLYTTGKTVAGIGSVALTNVIGSDKSKTTGYMDGIIDELFVTSEALTSDNVDYLYNGGDPTGSQQYPFTPVDTPSFEVSAVDFWNDSAINTFWAKIDGTNYTTTNGTITTTLLENDTGTYTLEVGGTGTYFKETYNNIAVTTSYEAVLHQTETSFNSFEYITNNTLNSSETNYTIDGQLNTTFYLPAGTHTVLVEPLGYYAKNYTFNVSALDQDTLNVTDLYNSQVTINLNDIITGEVIVKNSTIIISNSTYGFNETYTNTNGTFNLNLTQLNYSITYFAIDYATTINNFTINSTLQEVNFSGYANNSVWINAFDSSTGATLTVFNVEIYDLNNSYTANDTSGVAMFSDVPSGVYTVSVTRSGYSTAVYGLTMTGGSHQTINAYMDLDSANTVDFTMKDLVSGSLLEDVDISQYRTINGSWTLVSSKETDLTGRARFTYITSIEYKFIFSVTGYTTKTATLIPLFDSYTVRLTSTVIEEPDTTGYYITVSPSLFYDETLNNLTFIISSAGGTIESYTVNITAPNVSIENDYLTANGGEHAYNFTISGGTIGDRLTITYTVKETGKSAQTFTKIFNIVNKVDTSGFFQWGESDNTGMGDFEKVLIATFLLLIITTIIALGSNYAGVSPLLPTAIGFVLFLTLFAIIGFVPMWSLYIVGLALFLIVIFSLRNG